MVQLAGAIAFGLAAAAFLWEGDPILGFVFVICALVWAGTTWAQRPMRRPATDEHDGLMPRL
jgi:hypothetical protein